MKLPNVDFRSSEGSGMEPPESPRTRFRAEQFCFRLLNMVLDPLPDVHYSMVFGPKNGRRLNSRRDTLILLVGGDWNHGIL